MSDEPKQERRASQKGSSAPFGSSVDASAAGSAPRQQLPSLDEVFLNDEEVDLGEEDTKSVAAVDALGQPGVFELDDDTHVLDSSQFEAPAPPSNSRQSVPAPISMRPRVSAPPMFVSQVRAPTGAPPPFVARMPTLDLSDDVEYAPPEDYDSDAEAAPPLLDPEEQAHEAEFLDADAEPEEEPEYVDAELQPEASPMVSHAAPVAPALASRSPAAPWDAPRSPADPSLNALFAATQSRSGGLPPPPPPSITPRPPGSAPNQSTSFAPPPLNVFPSSAPAPTPTSASLAAALAPTPLAPVADPLPPVDRYKVPKTLVSGPPPDVPREPLPSLPPEPKSRAGWSWGLVVVAVGIAAAGFWYLESTQPGSLLLNVDAPGADPPTGLALYLDGQLACRATPCEIAELSQGTHFVRAEADGFPAIADQAVIVRARQRTTHDVILERPAGDARVTITTAVPGFRVTLDDQVRGTSPLEISGLDPGEHKLLLEKEGFEGVPETIRIERGQTLMLQPSPKLLRGTLEVAAASGSEDAEVRLDGELVALPINRALDAATPHMLTARKPGFATFERRIEFSAAQPSVVVTIDLTQAVGALAAGNVEDRPNGSTGGSARAPSGKATLNFNSLPKSMVVLDGRPLGQTPLMGVSVSPGSHNIVFVHPERGRKPVQVSVDEGAKRTVSVRF